MKRLPFETDAQELLCACAESLLPVRAAADAAVAQSTQMWQALAVCGEKAAIGMDAAGVTFEQNALGKFLWPNSANAADVALSGLTPWRSQLAAERARDARGLPNVSHPSGAGHFLDSSAPAAQWSAEQLSRAVERDARRYDKF